MKTYIASLLGAVGFVGSSYFMYTGAISATKAINDNTPRHNLPVLLGGIVSDVVIVIGIILATQIIQARSPELRAKPIGYNYCWGFGLFLLGVVMDANDLHFLVFMIIGLLGMLWSFYLFIEEWGRQKNLRSKGTPSERGC